MVYECIMIRNFLPRALNLSFFEFLTKSDYSPKYPAQSGRNFQVGSSIKSLVRPNFCQGFFIIPPEFVHA